MISQLEHKLDITIDCLTEGKLKINVPIEIKKLYKIFKKNKKQFFLVGGAVRDAILGKRPKDFDITTNATPDEVVKIVEKHGFKTTEVGKSFGVVVVNGHEIATFRKDIGKGRRPDSVDYTDIKGDVKRRDLTINALFYDIGTNEIVDLVGGIKDLKKRKIRTVGQAELRFDEDPLRKLRAVRFTGVIGGNMSVNTHSAIKDNPSISGVSSERIRDEFLKGIKKSESTKLYLKLADELGLLKQILSGLVINRDFINGNNPLIQLAYLLIKNSPDKVERALKRLKYENSEVSKIKFLLRMLTFKPKDILLVKKEQDRIKIKKDLIDAWGRVAGLSALAKKITDFKLTIKGSDIMALGFKGKDIGDKQKEMETKKFLGELEDKFNSILDVLLEELRYKNFRELFNALPKPLQKRVFNLKNVKQSKKNHPEGNVLKHTITVVNRSLKSGDIDMALASLFHDIGKDETAGFNEKTGLITHHGHEKVSAKLVKDYTKWIKSVGGNVANIYYIVKNHMKMKVFDVMRPHKQGKLSSFRAFSKLKKFSKDIDKGGLVV